MLFVLLCFFFFKQKTAYEMRISDWSSDVCSSDLPPATSPSSARPSPPPAPGTSTSPSSEPANQPPSHSRYQSDEHPQTASPCAGSGPAERRLPGQVGRASCGERVGQ